MKIVKSEIAETNQTVYEAVVPLRNLMVLRVRNTHDPTWSQLRGGSYGPTISITASVSEIWITKVQNKNANLKSEAEKKY